MRLLGLAPSLWLILALACQSGSGGTGVATSGGEVSSPEHAASSQDEDRNRAAEREAAERWAERAAEHAARERAIRERWRERIDEQQQAQAERSR
jgi:hypothetical protein